eukprot:TRINITY_DN153_c0_g1_i1.p1 TRINITY_DN153_c0_g1~~TRINITY_DN153_c0_g1_i1.p1  ORF type:complete len:311 (-),score=47.25 TRINITY_DN153_c0_g1_i1:77-1009(-)
MLEKPIERGIVKNWHDMEKIWHHLFFNEMKTNPAEHPVLVSEVCLNPKSNREKIAEHMFETFEVPAMHVVRSSELILIASGRGSSIVVDSGDGVTQVVPVYEGNTISSAIIRLDLAGQDITDYLVKLAIGTGHSFLTSFERELIREVKENLCLVSMDYDQEILDAQSPSDLEKSYELPDGQVLKFGKERFLCGEALFQPNLLGMECLGIHEAIYNSIMKCPVDSRLDLYGNILISGGSTMFPGFVERLQKEVTALSPSTTRVKLNTHLDRKLAVWVGGSILASLSSFQDKWVSRDNYDECGPGAVHTMCF